VGLRGIPGVDHRGLLLRSGSRLNFLSVPVATLRSHNQFEGEAP
jgi:hypothetical protein